MIRRSLPWLAVGSALAIVVQPLLGPPIHGHDTLLHFYRIPEINALLRHGVWFSRWSPDLFLGYGYPLFNFYPPLSAYLLTLAYWLVGAHAPAALNVAFGLTLIMAGVGMFLLARELYGEAGGVFAAAAYVLSPHLLYHTFERGSLSNALAMGLFPFAALTLVRAARRPDRRWAAWAAFTFAAVLLSHTASSLAFAAPLAVIGLAAALSHDATGGTTRRARAARPALTLAVGAALSAFIWLPALAEYRLTQYTLVLTSPDLDFRHFFADVLRWPEPALAGLTNPPLPVTVGLGQLALGLAALGPALIQMARRRQLENAEVITLLGGLMGLGAVFLASPLSTPLWENLSLLRNFQFPWRWLDPGAFLLALVCGSLAREAGRQRWRIGLIGLGLVIFFANAAPYLYPPRTQSLPDRPTLADASSAQLRYGIYGLTSWGEYAPATARFRPTEPPFPGADLGATLDVKLKRDDLPAGALIAATGGPTRATLRLSLPAAQTLVFHTFYFPGWSARVDGKPVPTGPDDDGLLQLTAPAGEHLVSVYFGETPLRALADVLSLVAAALVGLTLLVPRRWIARPHRQPDPEAPARPESPLPATMGHASSVTYLLSLAAVLFALAAFKFIWLDHFDSPLVIHLQDEKISGTTAPEWRDFGGELRLVGYRVDAPDRLTLYWQAERPPAQAYAIQVSLADARGIPVATVTHDHPGLSPTSYWEASQLIRDEYALPLAEAQRPIGYRLAVAVVDPATGQFLRLRDSPDASARASPIGTVKLAPEKPDTGSGDQAVGAIFGEAIELERAAFPAEVAAGTPVAITLYWKSLAPVAEDYTVFVHMLNPDGTLAAGNDSQPRGGLYPTSFWSPGEVIPDKRQWIPSVAPGAYQLEVGLYLLGTAERLAVSGAHAELGDRVILGKVTVKP
ncbi:MAG: hypothetical protein HW418_451 [Anaerolineales bacterium]|nr:hypothetical protein [Anaerolineales bacterium]